MRPRTVFTGCLAGLCAGQILVPIINNYWPVYIKPEFAQGSYSESSALLRYAICGLIILVGGYASARLDWARSLHQAVMHGISAGLLAGCVAYMFSGASAGSGILGQKEILLSLSAPVTSESIGIGLLVLGVVNTAVWVQGIFWTFLVSAIALGALGGLLSRLEKSAGWFTEPHAKKPGLERLAAYSLIVICAINLVIVVSVLSLLSDVTAKAIIENNSPTPGILAAPIFILVLPLVTTAIAFMGCIILTTKWALEAWIQPYESYRAKIWLAISAIFVLILFFANAYVALAVLVLITITIIVVWLIERQNTTENKVPNEVFPYSPFDYLASGLVQGVLAGTLSTVSLLAYSLALVLIAIVDIPHLTLSGVVNKSPQEQIQLLYSVLASANASVILANTAVGLFIAWIGGVTGILRSSSVKPLPEIDMAALIQEEADKQQREKKAAPKRKKTKTSSPPVDVTKE